MSWNNYESEAAVRKSLLLF